MAISISKNHQTKATDEQMVAFKRQPIPCNEAMRLEMVDTKKRAHPTN